MYIRYPINSMKTIRSSKKMKKSLYLCYYHFNLLPMKKTVYTILALLFLSGPLFAQKKEVKKPIIEAKDKKGTKSFSLSKQSTSNTPKEKTVFQTDREWRAETDNRGDVAIIYGTMDRPGMTFEQRVQSWRDKGYSTHFMTGIAWGEYKDYFTGQWDGKKNHLREGQKTMQGDTIWHGRLIPYIVPTSDFIKYMEEKHIKRVIDAGISVIYLEEPEFWARAGYSDAFKDEWVKYYGFPWRPQHESPENTYLANKLKYHLYYNALKEVFTYAKKYGKSKGMDVKCYVPTHSLVNYSSWQIVSPEASLASLPCVDGYIAQVWTGTSREPTFYNGKKKERVFENAFLEYGSMQSMVAPTKRKIYFLTDPIEDRSKDWEDYKRNYQATFTAQLLFPMIADYEIMPWPDRIYTGLYNNPKTDKKERIPRYYSTQMQVMINALNEMPVSSNRVNGSHGIGVLMANSLMFQRFPEHTGYEDPMFSNFYGQTLPLIKRGIPVDIIHMENLQYANTWDGLKVLIMSYANMKPLSEKTHSYISKWVKNGGTLVYCGKDMDPYQGVMEWWNTGSLKYKTPSLHLFKQLGIANNPQTGKYHCGKGTIFVIREEPKDFVLNTGGDKVFFKTVKDAYENTVEPRQLTEKNDFYLERGPYIIAAVVDENTNSAPLIIKGSYIDLFDPTLPVVLQKSVNPGEQTFLYDLSKVTNVNKPQVLCGAARVYNELYQDNCYSFTVKSPINTTNVSRIYLPIEPIKVIVSDKSGAIIEAKNSWDKISKTCLLEFENSPEGIKVMIQMKK